MLNELPTWAYFLGMGVALAAWVEARVVLRKECKLKHDQVDLQIAERKARSHELRNMVTPLTLNVSRLEQHVDDMHDTMKDLLQKLESKPCIAGKRCTAKDDE